MFNKRLSKCGKNQNQALFVRIIDDICGMLLMNYYKLLFHCFSFFFFWGPETSVLTEYYCSEVYISICMHIHHMHKDKYIRACSLAFREDQKLLKLSTLPCGFLRVCFYENQGREESLREGKDRRKRKKSVTITYGSQSLEK